ncbi:hypothetical protein QZH41_008401 [Actinostola sp. cb2023]|nr:hypothetical protein QZH41_008401 [Actinostola sp. cb2023]
MREQTQSARGRIKQKKKETRSTERKYLENCEEIVKESLPKHKLVQGHFRDTETAQLFLLNQVTFCQERAKFYEDLKKTGKFTRDFGNHQEDVDIEKEGTCTSIVNNTFIIFVKKT